MVSPLEVRHPSISRSTPGCRYTQSDHFFNRFPASLWMIGLPQDDRGQGAGPQYPVKGRNTRKKGK